MDMYDKIAKMHDEIEQMYKKLMMPQPIQTIKKQVPEIRPELQETESSLIATLRVPNADDVNLDIRANSVGIIAQRKMQKSIDNVKSVTQVQQFKKILPLPTMIDPQNTIAVYQDNVLKLTMPKVELKSKRMKLK
ncbi:MAG: Hsp20/alpha crystallin family protein [Nanoarchaeota archaeon]|nr:Hsp20/alpha crystallin family protein [Nanoarchaeota archaeon]MBU1704312.1 Hsp20/alpha crystallin family protein [Nanoarchaeota archaeon]